MQKYKTIVLYLLLISIGFVFAVIRLKPAIMGIYHVEKGIKAKKIESADLDRKLETLKASAMQKMAAASTTKNIYKPAGIVQDAEASFTVIFDDIINMAKFDGIKIYSIEYTYNPQDDDFVKGAPDKYNVCTIKMEVIADYVDLQDFLKEIYKYPYLINIDKLELIPYARNKKILLSTIQLKLYSSK